MNVHSLKDGDVLVIGIRQPLSDDGTWRKNAEDGFAKSLGVKVKVIVVVDAPGLFEVLRAEDE